MQTTTTLELTHDELQALVGILDAGTKALGLQAVVPLAPVLAKLEAAGETFAPASNGADKSPEATEAETL